MVQVVTFEVKVESDQELPPIGTAGDWATDQWSLLDVKLVGVGSEMDTAKTTARDAEIIFAPGSDPEDQAADVAAIMRLLADAELATVYGFSIFDATREVEVTV